VERQESPVPHRVFHVVPEYPQVQYVAQQVQPATVQKLRGEERQGRRHHRQALRQTINAEEHRRDQPERVDNGLASLQPQRALP
jgi:hypothetical protein